MIMVAHNNISIKPPATPVNRFKQSLLKRFLRTFASKYILSIVTTIDNMINSSRKFDARFAWHKAIKANYIAVIYFVNLLIKEPILTFGA